MENYAGLKLKRKEFDDADEEVFADFCLNCPASKIRRLDADLPPIIGQDTAGIPLKHEHPNPESFMSDDVINQVNPVEIEELPFVPENDEKAIVLFKPMNKFYSPNKFSIDPNLISKFKSRALSHATRSAEEKQSNGDNSELNGCMAIIPWAPSQPVYQRPILASQTEEALGSMESEEDMMDTSMMEIEEEVGAPNACPLEVNEYIKQSTINEQWQQQQLQQQQQQQHCMIPQPPQNVTTPIVWYR